jgi:hypothetical protein
MNRDLFTRPDPFTPRSLSRPAEYGSAVTRYSASGKNRPWLNILLAVGIGLGLGVLLAWRG